MVVNFVVSKWQYDCHIFNFKRCSYEIHYICFISLLWILSSISFFILTVQLAGNQHCFQYISIAHLSIVQMKSILDKFFHDSCLLSISNRKSFIHHLFHCQYFQSLERQHDLHGQNMRIEKIQYSFLLVCLVLVISHSFDLDFEMKSNRHDASSRGIFKRAKGAKSSMKKTKASSKEPKSSSRRLKHFKTTKAPTITSTKQPTNESPTKSSKTPKARRLTKVI